MAHRELGWALHVCSVALQHSWTYAPLVADVLGMASNRVSVPEPTPAGAAPGRAPTLKSYEVRLMCAPHASQGYKVRFCLVVSKVARASLQ